jgi:hypothetical protein
MEGLPSNRKMFFIYQLTTGVGPDRPSPGDFSTEEINTNAAQ